MVHFECPAQIEEGPNKDSVYKSENLVSEEEVSNIYDFIHLFDY